jgi:hypothetical protein
VTTGRGRGSKVGRRKGSPRGRGSETFTTSRREGTERRENWQKKRIASKLIETGRAKIGSRKGSSISKKIGRRKGMVRGSQAKNSRGRCAKIGRKQGRLDAKQKLEEEAK